MAGLKTHNSSLMHQFSIMYICTALKRSSQRYQSHHRRRDDVIVTLVKAFGGGASLCGMSALIWKKPPKPQLVWPSTFRAILRLDSQPCSSKLFPFWLSDADFVNFSNKKKYSIWWSFKVSTKKKVLQLARQTQEECSMKVHCTELMENFLEKVLNFVSSECW